MNDQTIIQTIEAHMAMEQKAWAWDALRAGLTKLSSEDHPIIPVIMRNMDEMLDLAAEVLQTAKVKAQIEPESESSLQLSLF